MIKKQVKINTEYIKMDQLLKFCGLVSAGSEAKQAIQNGKVKYNNTICIERGKKIRSGDSVEYEETLLEVI